MAGEIGGMQYIPKDDIEFLGQIGEGGFGAVYKGFHKKLAANVAVKLLTVSPGTFSSKEAEEELKREASKLFHARHNNIVSFFGMCVDWKSEACGLVMEYVELGSLRDLMRKAKVEWPLKVRMMTQVALGMNYLHNLQPIVLHLDLKAMNILISDDCVVKICDFGLSRVKKATAAMMTMPGGINGTVSHIPPDSLRSTLVRPTEKFDVYSYAVVLWETITEQDAYAGAVDIFQVMICVINGERPDLNQLPRGISQEYRRVLNETLIPLMKRCWEGEPERRPYFSYCIEKLNPITNDMKTEALEATLSIHKQFDSRKKSTHKPFKKKMSFSEVRDKYLVEPPEDHDSDYDEGFINETVVERKPANVLPPIKEKLRARLQRQNTESLTAMDCDKKLTFNISIGRINNISAARYGNLLISGTEGLARCDTQGTLLEMYSLPITSVMCALEDKTGKLIIAGPSEMYVRKNKKWIKILSDVIKRPWSLDLDRRGNLVILDGHENKIYNISSMDYETVCQVINLKDFGDWQVPCSVSFSPKGSFIITDRQAHTISIMTSDRSSISTIGDRGSGLCEFNSPRGTAVHENGDIAVVETWNNRIQVLDDCGRHKNFIVIGKDNVQCPNAVCITRQNYLVVGELFSGNVHVYSYPQFTEL